jgi:hypothetical protein
LSSRLGNKCVAKHFSPCFKARENLLERLLLKNCRKARERVRFEVFVMLQSCDEKRLEAHLFPSLKLDQNKTTTKKFVPVSKTSGWDICLQKIIRHETDVNFCGLIMYYIIIILLLSQRCHM